ncbi:hypothetical protein RSSM_02410 [Rhodopirellula sallentina SM41]|uniref:Uncharacterized protein n=1 Tax=Rhodopirellula sallentina SM41 TaxID=1263870 RepID=M5UE72_9BACT|nr:hypothetical protein RSSM_02410 [Rhodopirellula sallentina SM41]
MAFTVRTKPVCASEIKSLSSLTKLFGTRSPAVLVGIARRAGLS